MIRTVALVGHAGSGKTTLTEALLYKTGAKERRGRVEEGTTTTDYTPEAKLHRTTVRTGVAPLRFRGHRVFLLDAPGAGAFVGEMRKGPGPWRKGSAFPGWWWSPSWTRAGTTTPSWRT